MKVAIVCDWLVSVGGAEQVLKSICELFPEAPIYTSQYNARKIDWFKNREIKVGYLQTFPTNFRRFLGPLRQKYFSHLDLSNYDLIISVTGAEAKSIKKGNALHLCYCHVPTQYYWGLKDDYLKNPGFGILNPVARLGLKALLPPLKKADYKAAQLPDEFITISTYAAEQIKSAYNREATIIFPPVAVEKFSTKEFSTSRETINHKKSQVRETEQEDNKKAKKSNKKLPETEMTSVKSGERYGFVTTSRQVNWKRLDLAVRACMELKLPLTVIGEGPEHRKLKKLARRSRNIKFVPVQDQKGIKHYLEHAEGYIFPSLEPFGIAPVEALACGCPVVAYGNGGALDYVIDGENGVLFGKQSVNSLRQALKRFSTIKFNEEKIRKSALPFSEKIFKEKLKTFVTAKVKEHQKMLSEKVKEEGNIKPEKVKSAAKPSEPTELVYEALDAKVMPKAKLTFANSKTSTPSLKLPDVEKPPKVKIEAKPAPKPEAKPDSPEVVKLPAKPEPNPKPKVAPKTKKIRPDVIKVKQPKPKKKAKKHVAKKPPEGSRIIKID